MNAVVAVWLVDAKCCVSTLYVRGIQGVGYFNRFVRYNIFSFSKNAVNAMYVLVAVCLVDAKFGRRKMLRLDVVRSMHQMCWEFQLICSMQYFSFSKMWWM